MPAHAGSRLHTSQFVDEDAILEKFWKRLKENGMRKLEINAGPHIKVVQNNVSIFSEVNIKN